MAVQPMNSSAKAAALGGNASTRKAASTNSKAPSEAFFIGEAIRRRVTRHAVELVQEWYDFEIELSERHLPIQICGLFLERLEQLPRLLAKVVIRGVGEVDEDEPGA